MSETAAPEASRAPGVRVPPPPLDPAAAGLPELPDAVELRPPALVMDPARLSVMRPGPFSFVRSLVARLIDERWSISRTRTELDERGHGIAVYAIRPPQGGAFTAVVYSGERDGDISERAYEADWDILVWLFDGDAGDERIAAAAAENARIVRGLGRAGADVLSWTRGNRSARLFGHVVERLAEGRQPDVEEVARIGYLIRNVYYQANGMNGTRMYGAYPDDHPLAGAYHVQMLGLYLMRQFSLDLAEHVARARSPQAVPLDPDLRRYVGVGNSTGLGLNLLVWNHPQLVNRWLLQRETAVALLAAAPAADAATAARLAALLRRYAAYCREDLTDYEGTLAPRVELADQLDAAAALADELAERGTLGGEAPARPWAALLDVVARTSCVEADESVRTLLTEVHPRLVAALAAYASAAEDAEVVPGATVGALRELLRAEYDWAWTWDVDDAGAQHWVWYKSAEGEEPRRGVRAAGHVGPEHDLLPSLPFELRELDAALAACPPETRVGRFLADAPRWRALVARVQSVAGLPYHTVRHDLHERDAAPLHLSRFALSSLKGLDKLYSMGDQWVRGVFLQGAPTIDELTDGADPAWTYPPRPPAR